MRWATPSSASNGSPHRGRELNSKPNGGSRAEGSCEIVHPLRSWLDSWSAIGHVAVGMHRQGYDLQLTQYDDRGWRATFYTTGMEHSPTSGTGTAWEHTPWHATQRAAGEALRRASADA